jgi:hypothetical protein
MDYLRRQRIHGALRGTRQVQRPALLTAVAGEGKAQLLYEGDPALVDAVPALAGGRGSGDMQDGLVTAGLQQEAVTAPQLDGVFVVRGGGVL